MEQLSYKLTALYMNKDFLKVVESMRLLIESNLLNKKEYVHTLPRFGRCTYNELASGSRACAAAPSPGALQKRKNTTMMTKKQSRLGVKEGWSRSDLSMCHVT